MSRKILFMVIFVGGGVSAWAENFTPPDTDFYLGYSRRQHKLGGDFKGNSFYASNNNVFFVPNVDDAWGNNFFFGMKFNTARKHAFGFELAYAMSKHDGDFLGVPMKSNYGVLNIDVKYYLNAASRFQPFGLIGLNVGELKVEEGAETYAYSMSGPIYTGSGKATYRGSGFNVGAGLLTYLTPRLALHVAAVRASTTFDEVEGGGGEWELSPKLKTSNIIFDVGLSFRWAAQ